MTDPVTYKVTLGVNLAPDPDDCEDCARGHCHQEFREYDTGEVLLLHNRPESFN